MALAVDLVYLLVLAVTAPIWLVRRRGRVARSITGRFGAVTVPPRRDGRRRVVIHGVSVGEINAIRSLVHEILAAEPAIDLVIAASTETGVARANQLFAGRHPVVRHPLDFSSCVKRFLDATDPDVFASVELEIWPNLTAACSRRGIPFVVVNGRLSERSFRRYRRIRSLIRPSFRRITRVLAQDEPSAERFARLGTPRERIEVTGSMKWDGAHVIPQDVDPASVIAGAEALAAAMGIDRTRPLVVAGSSAPDEHELLRDAVPGGVQLLCAPRRPEWFHAAADVLEGCARRSSGGRGSTTDRFLLDSIGELQAAYALATVVVIGRSFGSLHGSDMMEPAAMGKPIVIGPSAADFQAAVEALREGRGIVQCGRSELRAVLGRLLSDDAERSELARRAREVVRAKQGASRRSAEVVASLARLAPLRAKEQSSATSAD